MGQVTRSFVRLRTQFDNIGDALINGELLRRLASESEVYVDASGCPSVFVDDVLEVVGHGRRDVHVFRRAGTFRLFTALIRSRARRHRCCYFLLPGGITGEKSPFAAWRALAFVQLLRLLKALGITTCQLGVSYSRLGSRYARVLARRAEAIERHYVRDRATLDYARAHGIRVDGVAPDLAFGLRPVARITGPHRSCLAFSFRFDNGRCGLAKRVFDLFQRAVAASGPTVSYRIVSQVRRDDEPLERLYARIRERYPELDVDFVRATTIDEGLRAYADVATIFSNRLHALLMAAAMGAAPVAVVDPVPDAKIVGLLSDLGLGHCIADVDDDVSAMLAVGPIDPSIFAAQDALLRRLVHEMVAGDGRMTVGEPRRSEAGA